MPKLDASEDLDDTLSADERDLLEPDILSTAPSHLLSNGYLKDGFVVTDSDASNDDDEQTKEQQKRAQARKLRRLSCHQGNAKKAPSRRGKKDKSEETNK